MVTFGKTRSRPWYVQVLTWAGRVIGLFLFLMVLAFLIGEGPPNILQFTPIQSLQFTTFAILTCGLLLAWRFPLAGSLLTLAGLAGFYFLEYLQTHSFPRGAFPLFALPPALLLVAAILRQTAHPKL